MAVTFVLGRAGAGKTRYCIDRVAEALSKSSQERLILLVPEQASFQMERALAAHTAVGGYWRAEVLSFTRLARRIFNELGAEPPMLASEARRFVLYSIAVQAEPHIERLRPLLRSPGFVQELEALIDEWIAERVSPQALREAAGRMSDAVRARRITELAWFYEQYLAWLEKHCIDPSQRLEAVRAQLTNVAWMSTARVFADGFAGFTAEEMATLVALGRTCRQLTITLLVDPHAPAIARPTATPDPLGLFARVESTYARLLSEFQQNGVAVTDPIRLTVSTRGRFAAEGLRTLEQELARPWAAPREFLEFPTPSDGVRLVACETPRHELRAAARFIGRRVLESDGRVRFRDCAVIARNLDPLAALVREVFTEFEIPYFLDRRRPLRAHPLVALTARIWDVALSDFALEPVVALLRTGLLPIGRASAEALENLAVEYSARGEAAWGAAEWFRCTRASDPTIAAIRARIVAAISPLRSLCLADDSTGAVWARTVYGAIDALGVPEQLAGWIADARRDQELEKAEAHRFAWDSLRSALQHLHTILGNIRLPANEAASLLNLAVASDSVALAPPTVDEVLVSAIERSRHPEIRFAWLIGLNEGVFPARPVESALLSDSDRVKLADAGLPNDSASEQDILGERLLAYIAMTRPAEELVISYARVGLDGGELFPSPLLRDVQRALRNLSVEEDRDDGPPTCLPDLARRYLNAGQADARLRQLVQLASRDDRLGPPLTRMLRGLGYHNSCVSLGDALAPAGASWRCSVSDVETYLQCPFKYFASRALRIKAIRGPLPLDWELGDAAHAVLAEVTRRGMSEPGGVRAVNDERWLELLRGAIDANREGVPDDYAARRPQSAYLHRLLMQRLSDLLLAHADRWRRSAFEPILVEAPTGRVAGTDVNEQTFLLEVDGHGVEIVGRIDRVDRARHEGVEWLTIYDYKRTIQPLSKEFLVSPVLQVFIYAAALRRNWPAARLGAVFFAPWVADTKAAKPEYFRDSDAGRQRMFFFRPVGVIDEQAATLIDARLSRAPSPVARLQLMKDGTRLKGGDAVRQEQLNLRIDAAVDSVRLAATGANAGSVAISPLVVNRRLACQTCDFRELCRFERALNPVRAAERVLPNLKADAGEEGRDESDE